MALIIIFIISFVAIAFFCASEMAFSTANRIKIRLKAKSGGFRERKVYELVNDPDKFLVPTLVGTNIASVAYASALAYILIDFGIVSVSYLELTLYESVLLVIFAEVIPKVLSRNSANKVVYIFVIPFLFFKFILYPINVFIGKISRSIMKLMRIPLNKNDWLLVTKNDIDSIVDEAVKADTVKKHDAKIINRIMSLDETKVKEIMLHRKSIIGVDVNSSIYKLKKLVILSSLSKIIVYENDLDHITGVVFVNDLLKDVKKIKGTVRPVLFIPESTSILSLFNVFKKEKSSIAIIIDEFGGSIGLVTMHDILERIVGKVDDEHDKEMSDRGIIYRDEQKSFVVSGNADPGELENMIRSISGREECCYGSKYETINGFIINRLKRIPEQGEIFEINGLTYKIVKAKKNFIENLIIQLPIEKE